MLDKIRQVLYTQNFHVIHEEKIILGLLLYLISLSFLPINQPTLQKHVREVT